MDEARNELHLAHIIAADEEPTSEDEYRPTRGSLQKRLTTPGGLLSQEDLSILCHQPELADIANQSSYVHTFAENQFGMNDCFIDCTVESLAAALCVVPQAIHVFVSWMLPLKDPELEAERNAALNDGIMCWLPDGMDVYERSRLEAHTGRKRESWVEMLQKPSYTEFKRALEAYNWPPAMQTMVIPPSPPRHRPSNYYSAIAL
jgi:hypothetical protein